MRTPRSTVLLSILATTLFTPAFGCSADPGAANDAGSSDAAAANVPPSLSPFVGQWTFATGTATLTCGLDPPRSTVPDDRIVISPGPVPETLSVDDGGCVLIYNVTGPVASSPLGGACNGSVVETTIETKSNGLLHFSGVTGLDDNGQHCTVAIDGYLSRV
jgi:hypothetical protein